MICGSHPIELLDEGFELIVKNPGIPYHNPLVKGALKEEFLLLLKLNLPFKLVKRHLLGLLVQMEKLQQQH